MALLRTFIRPPVFPDEDKTRTARHLNAILFMTARLLGGMFVLLVIRRYAIFEPTAFTVGALAVVMVGLLFVLKRGYVRAASYLYLAIGWLGLSVLAWSADGIRDVAFVAYFVIILAAGLLLSWREAVAFTGLSILASWVLAYGETSGILAPTLDHPYNYARDATVILVLIASLLYFIISSLQRSLTAARQGNIELAALSAQLEERVAARTTDLNLAAQIGREVAQVRDLDFLLPYTVALVCEQFDLYQVQIYLTDEPRQNLVLRASAGHAGQQLLTAGHRLPLDENSINGTAVIQKQSIIVADTRQSPLFRPHPLLPSSGCEKAAGLAGRRTRKLK